ncbi:nucleoside hydrolase [Paenibacillus faecalis]|uniref:nucleoside hydrolase n=1 Tax=Paenibacillus faecalis TaxID=2079532 RepID=UPI000D0FFED8|nr:nucleoside hydrolase [Paenibacillus faecalis]
MTNRIIIDTDIGSDIDDAMALALAMRSKELVIEGITTVYGDVDLRAKLAKKLLQLGGRDDVKVFAGINQPLLHNRDIWMAGHEGEGVLTDYEHIKYEHDHAVDFMVKTIMDHPGEITLIPIGPLTNIAAAIIREPKIVEHVKEIILMGGVTRLGHNALELPKDEHNIRCDPEAAALVFRSGAPIVMVGLDVTYQVTLSKDDRNRLEASQDPLNLALVKQLDRWFDFINEDTTKMHDPLTVSLMIDRSMVKTEKMSVYVDYDHRQMTGQTVALPDQNGNVEVCLEVDSQQFSTILFDRLLSN